MDDALHAAGPKLIVVTRPREASEALAATLKARGYEVLVEPLIEIAPCAADLPDLSRYDALAFTSANGVTAFAAASAVRDLPCYAVGKQTEMALLAAGFSDVRRGDGDAVALAGRAAQEQPAGTRILHVAGKDVSKDLGALLADSGIIADRATLYEALPAQTLSKRLVEALYACTIDSVLLFSARTAGVFERLVSKAGLTGSCSGVRAICLSPQVADTVRGLPWRALTAPAEPTTEALLALLTRD